MVKGVGEKPPTSLPPFTSPKSTIHGLVYIPNMDLVRNDVIFLVASPGGHHMDPIGIEFFCMYEDTVYVFIWVLLSY